MQRLLQARHSLQEDFRALLERSSLRLAPVSPRRLLIVGNLSSLDSDLERRSFELFRNSAPAVDVVTFDELLAKTEQLVELLTVRGEGASVP